MTKQLAYAIFELKTMIKKEVKINEQTTRKHSGEYSKSYE